MKHGHDVILLFLSALTFACASEPRHFSLFSVITFKNEECQAKSTAGLKGVCMSTSDCSGVGTSDGNCAASFGVCCIVRFNTCGSTVNRNCSYIDNPGYPSTFTTVSTGCVYTISQVQTNICQIRLDFFDTVLIQPNSAAATAGTCATTSLTTAAGTSGTGGSIATNPPVLCGTLTGQHIYVDSGRQATAATLTFVKTTTGADKWRIKVSQIECYSSSKAPNGCLQYFSGNGGIHTVTSFNWDGTKTCATGCLLAPQYYRVCFRPERGMCGNGYSQSAVSTTLDAFDFSENQADTNAEGLLAEVGSAECSESYLQIPSTAVLNDDRFCGSGSLSLTTGAGNTAGGTVYARASDPWGFQVAAITDIEAAQGGFSLVSQQLQCNSAGIV